MLDSVLVANRGEIASRVIRTARRTGIRAVAVYADADADLPYVREADEAIRIGPDPGAPGDPNPRPARSYLARSYLDGEAIIDAARKTGAAAVTGCSTCSRVFISRKTNEPVRVDAGYAAGNTVTPFYDPLLAKLCVYGADREQALDRARDAVAAFRIAGPKTNLLFHADLLASPEFSTGDYDTSLVSKLRPA